MCDSDQANYVFEIRSFRERKKVYFAKERANIHTSTPQRYPQLDLKSTSEGVSTNTYNLVIDVLVLLFSWVEDVYGVH
jgi:hypothetical protein